MAIKKTLTKDKKKCKVTFSLPAEVAPNAKSVRVVGDFNNWNWSKGVKLTKKKNQFQGAAELKAGQRHEFRYLIDNNRWENDWQADGYCATPYGCDNSVIVTSAAAAKAKSPSRASKAPTSKKQKPTSRAKTISKPSAKAKTKKSKSKIDFTVIEGVGPKIKQLLQKAGYKSFEDLSKAKVKDLRQILNNAGSRYQMHNPSQWAKQARFAAKDQWTKLNEFQATIKNGK
jgi:predicted flap endonuclease-1-like 5' DNA nuclease